MGVSPFEAGFCNRWSNMRCAVTFSGKNRHAPQDANNLDMNSSWTLPSHARNSENLEHLPSEMRMSVPQLLRGPRLQLRTPCDASFCAATPSRNLSFFFFKQKTAYEI